MKKIFFIFKLILLLGIVGCDDSASTDGAGFALGDTSGGSVTFGNLYNAYVSKTSAYVEVKFSGAIGKNSGATSNNMVVIPIWYRNSGHYYVCAVTDLDWGGIDPDIAVGAYYDDAGAQNIYWSEAIKTTDAFSTSDTSEKTFGCELIFEGGLYKINAYLNGIKRASYTIGVLDGHDPNGITMFDPGITNSSHEGRAGFGFSQQWDAIKINSFKYYSKKP